MKQHPVLRVLGVAGVLALGAVAVPSQSSAEDPRRPGVWEGKTSQSLGKFVSYEAKKLRVEVGARKRRFDYVVDKWTSCGYSEGHRGTTMRCSQLDRKGYRGKPVRVLWRTDAKKRRIAVIVAVILGPRR